MESHEAPYKMPDGTQGKIPLVSAFPVYESFKDAYDDGIVSMPEPGDRLLGGHSSCIVGWKIIDDKEYFVNLNSWGSEIGDGGLFYLPIDYSFYPSDFFIIHNGPPADTPSECPLGTGIAVGLSSIAKLLHRRGRFSYKNPL